MSVRICKLTLDRFITPAKVSRKLPDNYRISYNNSTHIWITGTDEQGYTLDSVMVDMADVKGVEKVEEML